jgi:GT2 family glycosyltransferase
MNVAVLIVSYRSLDDVEACLGALTASDYSDFEVVVCENGGDEAFGQLREALPAALPGGQKIRLLPPLGNLGYAGGVNYGIVESPSAGAYWVLNPDTLPAPNTLTQLVSRLAQGDSSIVGHDIMGANGMLATRGGGRWMPWTGRAVSLDWGKPRDPRPPVDETERRMNYVMGTSMLVSRGFVERVGLMREDYFLYCEEIEWCLRGLRAGEKIGYAPEPALLHMHGTATGAGGAPRDTAKLPVYLQQRNRLNLTRDLYPQRLPVTATIALVHVVLKYARSRAWRQIGYSVQGWAAGMRNERGRPAWF